MTERGVGAFIICIALAPPPPNTSPLMTSQYLTILMTERERAPLSFVGFWRLPMPPPPPDATILNYLTDI